MAIILAIGLHIDSAAAAPDNGIAALMYLPIAISSINLTRPIIIKTAEKM